MRQVVVARPFAGGYRSDIPDYALNPNECAYAQDLIYPFGVAQQRWGWTYDGSTADVAANLVGVDRSRFPLVEQTATTTSDSAGKVYIHNAAASGTEIWTNPASVSTTWIPRCMYNGEVIYCAQDGVTPLLRYAGAPLAYSSGWDNFTSNSFRFPAGASEATLMSASDPYPADFTRGVFFTIPLAEAGGTGYFNSIASLSLRVLSRNSDTSVSLDGVRNPSASNTAWVATDLMAALPVGFAFPAVDVWDAGTVVSFSAGTWTLSGSNLTSAGVKSTPYFAPDAFLAKNPTPDGNYFMGDVSTHTATSVKTLAYPSWSVTSTTYKITRRLPFKDATVHKNSLWGTGVKQYPNRVYVGPPLWNIGLPPGAVEPFDVSVRDQFANVDEFLLLPIDVPSRYDSDPVVAVLSTPGPLLVLKGASVYGIFGTYPSLEQSMITTGAGCVDLRSAISVDGVAYWAGRDGIYSYAFGQIQNLTQGRIEREWQALMRGYVAGTSYVSAAVVAGHLVISAGGLTNTATGEAKIGPDSSNPSERTFVMDIKSGQWTSRLSNARIRNMATVRVPGEVPSIFGVSDDRQGRVIDLTPTVTGTKCTNRASQTLAAADPTDAAGTGPRMQAWSSASLAQASGIEGEARMLDLSMHTNLYDTAASPTAAIDVSSAHGDALDSPSTTVKAEGTITGDNADRVDRTKFRVNKTGRLHQVRIDMDTTPATTAKTQIPEMVASFRDNRRMT